MAITYMPLTMSKYYYLPSGDLRLGICLGKACNSVVYEHTDLLELIVESYNYSSTV